VATAFASILHREALRRLVDARTFDRGRQYLAEGRVSGVARRDAALVATVRGKDTEYRVRIWVTEHGLAYSCTGPMGEEGDFCKHAVAVGLAFVDQGEPEQKRIPTPPRATALERPQPPDTPPGRPEATAVPQERAAPAQRTATPPERAATPPERGATPQRAATPPERAATPQRAATPPERAARQPQEPAARTPVPERPMRPGAQALAWVDEARALLAPLDRTALVDLIVECGLEDPSIREVLLRAVRARGT
jgi:hypothetical protein